METITRHTESFSLDEFGEEGRTLDTDIEKELAFFRKGRVEAQDGFIADRFPVLKAHQEMK